MASFPAATDLSLIGGRRLCSVQKQSVTCNIKRPAAAAASKGALSMGGDPQRPLLSLAGGGGHRAAVPPRPFVRLFGRRSTL